MTESDIQRAHDMLSDLLRDFHPSAVELSMSATLEISADTNGKPVKATFVLTIGAKRD